MLGFTVNTHLTYIARQLAGIGLRLDRQVTVADDRAEMRAAVEEALAHSDVLIITGGLGPTSDDFTRDVVAELLGRKLVRDETCGRSHPGAHSQTGGSGFRNRFMSRRWYPSARRCCPIAMARRRAWRWITMANSSCCCPARRVN